MLAMRMFGQTTYGKQFIGSFLNRVIQLIAS